MNFPITDTELLLKLRKGEDSFTQFKAEVNNAESLAEEMVAFANGNGGYILVGIKEKPNGEGEVKGIENLKNLNNHISNASSENCVPAIFPQTQTLLIDDKTVVIIAVKEGNQKPYRTKSGKYLMRAGADKRAVSQEELSRMLQTSGSFHVEELAIREANFETELEKFEFANYFQKIRQESLSDFMLRSRQSLETILNNLSLTNGSELTLIGLLLFGKRVQHFRPLLMCQAVSYYDNDMASNDFQDKKDILGDLAHQFNEGMTFLKSNLRRVQMGEHFNEKGKLEISEMALQEALINALVHRDFNISSTIRLFVFENRVQIISPGPLPNHLTVAKITAGSQSIQRNPLLSTHARDLLPFSRMGTGIHRILKEHPNTDFENDVEGQQFIVTFWR